MVELSQKFVQDTLGPKAGRFTELNAKAQLGTLGDAETQELKDLGQRVLDTRSTNLDAAVDLGKLRFATSVLDDENSILAGNNILAEAGFPGVVKRVDGEMVVQNTQTGELISMNPRGFDTSDIGAAQATATNFAPLAGTLAGTLAGPLGAGAGGILSGIGAQAIREKTEAENIPGKDFSGLDVAGAGLGEAALNVAGLGAAKVLSPIARPLVAGAGKVIGPGGRRFIGEAVEGIGRGVQNLPGAKTAAALGQTVREGLEGTIGQSGLGRTLLGTTCEDVGIKAALKAGMTDEQINNIIRENPELASKMLSEAKDFQAQAGKGLANIVEPDTKKVEALFDLVDDVGTAERPGLGRQIQEQIGNKMQEGIKAERAGYEAALKIAKGEGAIKLDGASVIDGILSDKAISPDMKTEILKGLPAQFLTPGQSLDLASNLSGAISRSSNPAERAALMKAKATVTSNPDSLFNRNAAKSQALNLWRQTSGKTQARFDAFQDKFMNKVLGPKADFATGLKPRNLLDHAKAFDNFVEIAEKQPGDFQDLVQFAGFSNDKLEEVGLAQAKKIFKAKKGDVVKTLEVISDSPIVKGSKLGQQAINELAGTESQRGLLDQGLKDVKRGAKFQAVAQGQKDKFSNIRNPQDILGFPFRKAQEAAALMTTGPSFIPEAAGQVAGRFVANPDQFQDPTSPTEGEFVANPQQGAPDVQLAPANPPIKLKNANAPKASANPFNVLMGNLSSQFKNVSGGL